jgi:hypothetical protein
MTAMSKRDACGRFAAGNNEGVKAKGPRSPEQKARAWRREIEKAGALDPVDMVIVDQLQALMVRSLDKDNPMATDERMQFVRLLQTFKATRKAIKPKSRLQEIREQYSARGAA